MRTFKKDPIRVGVVGSTLVLTAAYFAGLAVAHASFMNTTSMFQAVGVVESLSQNELVMTTPGIESVTIQIAEDTVFIGGTPATGESVQISAQVRDGSAPTAVLVRRGGSNIQAVSGVGEGPVVVQSAAVLAKTDNTLTVESNIAVITFYVGDDTQFVYSQFEDIEPGDRVAIQGYDSGAGYIAGLVVGQEE